MADVQGVFGVNTRTFRRRDTVNGKQMALPLSPPIHLYLEVGKGTSKILNRPRFGRVLIRNFLQTG